MRKFRVFALIVVVAACTSEGGSTSTQAPATSTSTTSVPASTTVATTTTTEVGGCGEGEAMTEDGEVGAGGTSGDAEQIGAITWDTNPECEVFTIDFVTAQAAPATSAPTMSAEFLRSSAVVRVYLDLEATSVTDQLVQSGLVDRVYVARRPDRTLFVDFHLVAPALARVSVAESPGQVKVELEPGGGELDGLAAFAQNVVVISPTTGPVEVPTEITGYSRNFEANTIARISQGGSILDEDFTTAADWVETWGEYSLTLDPAGSGDAELFVGEQSAQDGSDRGVVIDIELP
ncbi:MAG TPA: Gmad2 immunoglobulin-like domain-containing protein [Acidimicrobiia bacterium]|nr:Gmad2 immunoglobulin-like domain-containing protein [Acidimicrobiia bacterium]